MGLNSTNSILNSKNQIKRFKNYKKFYVLLVKPNFGCSTKYIYSKVKKFNKARLLKPNKNMFNNKFLKKIGNSLEPIAFSKYNKLKMIKLFLEKSTTPIFVRMQKPKLAHSTTSHLTQPVIAEFAYFASLLYFFVFPY